MTHEETMVRTAYAKFAYAVQQGTIGRLAIEADSRGVPNHEPWFTSDQRLTAAQVDFTLSDFVVGDVQEIVNRKATDLISPADGKMLEPTSRNVSYSDQGLAPAGSRSSFAGSQLEPFRQQHRRLPSPNCTSCNGTSSGRRRCCSVTLPIL